MIGLPSANSASLPIFCEEPYRISWCQADDVIGDVESSAMFTSSQSSHISLLRPSTASMPDFVTRGKTPVRGGNRGGSPRELMRGGTVGASKRCSRDFELQSGWHSCNRLLVTAGGENCRRWNEPATERKMNCRQRGRSVGQLRYVGNARVRHSNTRTCKSHHTVNALKTNSCWISNDDAEPTHGENSSKAPWHRKGSATVRSTAEARSHLHERAHGAVPRPSRGWRPTSAVKMAAPNYERRFSGPKTIGSRI